MPVPPSYHAARRASVLIDLSARGRIVVGGADRASYLQGLLTNDIEALRSGEVVECAWRAVMRVSGRVLFDPRYPRNLRIQEPWFCHRAFVDQKS